MSHKVIDLLDLPPLPAITGARLPSKEQVLQNLLHHTKEGQNLKDAIAFAMHEVETFWQRTSLPTLTEINIRKRLTNLYDEHRKLLKEKKRETEGARMRREMWRGDLEEIFDIAAAKIMESKICRSAQNHLTHSSKFDDLIVADCLPRKCFEFFFGVWIIIIIIHHHLPRPVI